ncbi:hypothetical protein FHS18_000196 [Paenibacillus phyllosphaerae]|uniref:Uncharacterized protein n=1 Tax=Paenibacillus phyllosphaerae TaxID=274593 RepID=A0A7W5ASZ8_9BACL|nr:hypothetical protein [Paenibacillus phyllosphaerae]
MKRNLSKEELQSKIKSNGMSTKNDATDAKKKVIEFIIRKLLSKPTE